MKNQKGILSTKVKIKVSWSTYLAAAHQLHHEEEVLVVLVYVIQFDNVWMINLLQNIDLILQADFVFPGQLPPMNIRKFGQKLFNYLLIKT